MIAFPSDTCIWLVAGVTDMRKSFNGLKGSRYRPYWMKIPTRWHQVPDHEQPGAGIMPGPAG